MLAQLLLDELREHVDGGVVMTSLRHDNIGKTFAGLDELLVHWFEHAFVTLDNLLGCTTTLDDIALHNADKTFIGIGIHEDL